ncbi:hypothetical protein W97_03589 [Coniosporium apollinis CBS 100218]|uniref:Zinc/iron permease n=1 Tax=Coniosporium apollinis (strain CBS 100218) TaxID=1168221 RepID=R7YR68_CONA1|nr:uncharacterized protein W97_03589 [Coniosporium apollinis CBS 100218]EON64358.1 hypothetical protein W97_03589 [Coniosporium apollinis CBS 100218]
MVLENDTRGWIMTAASGLGLTVTASIICVDVLVRLVPGKRNFRIQDSNPFLSSSLSLSFGVMLFSSLYSMLPSSKSSLEKAGFSPKAAAWTLIGCFLAGVVGIQFLSRILHHYMPSHIVDCDHSHDEEEASHEEHHGKNGHPRPEPKPQRWRGEPLRPGVGLPTHGANEAQQHLLDAVSGQEARRAERHGLARRPSLHHQLTATMSKIVSGTQHKCDENGQCFGYSDPCGQDCFKNVSARGDVEEEAPFVPVRSETRAYGTTSPPSSGTLSGSPNAELFKTASAPSIQPEYQDEHEHGHQDGHEHHHDDYHEGHGNQPHHHHVPTNAFLSIGLQTSIAIALHKLPEGFITYATNHANPKLGFAVFLALFIHNITEGFAMALPLYLAINSRWKAMFWSSLLGGASQPLGAGVAALWFRLAGSGDMQPGEGVYGGMFAVTAGIMASVALQLFTEAWDLTHSRNLCMAFAFVGMGILGVSSALTA